jgi:hypothetical protein
VQGLVIPFVFLDQAVKFFLMLIQPLCLQVNLIDELILHFLHVFLVGKLQHIKLDFDF